MLLTGDGVHSVVEVLQIVGLEDSAVEKVARSHLQSIKGTMIQEIKVKVKIMKIRVKQISNVQTGMAEEVEEFEGVEEAAVLEATDHDT